MKKIELELNEDEYNRFLDFLEISLEYSCGDDEFTDNLLKKIIKNIGNK